MNQSQPRCSGSNLPFMMIITELYRVCRSQPCANTLPELLLSENGIIQLTVTLAARLADASYEATNGRWNDARHRYGFKIKKQASLQWPRNQRRHRWRQLDLSKTKKNLKTTNGRKAANSEHDNRGGRNQTHNRSTPICSLISPSVTIFDLAQI